MAVDIQNCLTTTTVIHNGAAIIGQNGLGNFTTFIANSGLTSEIIKQPIISEISGVYQLRFDDEQYY